MKHIIMITLCLLWWSNTTNAQCYTQLIDASGITLESKDIQALQDSACELRKVFPEALRDSFSVIDLGFYALTDDTEGGIAEFTRMAEDALRENPSTKYYLLFGRQSDSKNGPNSKIFIKLKLPTWGNFKCMTDMEKSLFQIRLELEIEKRPIVMPDTYVRIERDVMFKMKTMVVKVVDCCYAGRGCTQDCGNESEVQATLKKRGFTMTKCLIQSEVPAAQMNPNSLNRIITTENGKIANVDAEIQKYVDNFKLVHPDKQAKVYNYLYVDCNDIDLLLTAAEKDPAGLVVIVFLVGKTGEQGSIQTKVIAKPGLFIEPNGPGYLHFFDLFGRYLSSEFGLQYHGIFFKEKLQTDFAFRIGKFDNLNIDPSISSGDVIAHWSSFYLSDENIQFLKEKQLKSTKDQKEYGGLMSLTNKGRLNFDECTWCPIVSKVDKIPSDVLLDIKKYPNYDSKDFVITWHVHPVLLATDGKKPSGENQLLMEGTEGGDFFAFKNMSNWNGPYLTASTSPQNTWRLSGRIGIIGSIDGITIFHFRGPYFEPVKYEPHLSLYHYNGYSYQNKNYSDNEVKFIYTCISLDLSKIIVKKVQ